MWHHHWLPPRGLQDIRSMTRRNVEREVIGVCTQTKQLPKEPTFSVFGVESVNAINTIQTEPLTCIRMCLLANVQTSAWAVALLIPQIWTLRLFIRLNIVDIYTHRHWHRERIRASLDIQLWAPTWCCHLLVNHKAYHRQGLSDGQKREDNSHSLLNGWGTF